MFILHSCNFMHCLICITRFRTNNGNVYAMSSFSYSIYTRTSALRLLGLVRKLQPLRFRKKKSTWMNLYLSNTEYSGNVSKWESFECIIYKFYLLLYFSVFIHLIKKKKDGWETRAIGEVKICYVLTTNSIYSLVFVPFCFFSHRSRADCPFIIIFMVIIIEILTFI